MRTCPVCQSSTRTTLDPEYMNFRLYRCGCGMMYLDREEISQAWFDGFYLSGFTADDGAYSDARLASLASCVASYEPRAVLDIGGQDGELAKRLALRGIPCDVAGVQETEQGKYDAVILSHTLEHVYDVPAMLERVKRHLGNRLFIEVPIWLDDGPGYDYHWQHVNKFTAASLADLLICHGFHIAQSVRLPDYREYHVQRVIAW